MNAIAGSNIDDVRAEIMRLEDAEYFDQNAWARVLADMEAAGRMSGFADAKRRMETAKQTKLILSDPVILARNSIPLLLAESVAVETGV